MPYKIPLNSLNHFSVEQRQTGREKQPWKSPSALALPKKRGRTIGFARLGSPFCTLHMALLD